MQLKLIRAIYENEETGKKVALFKVISGADEIPSCVTKTDCIKAIGYYPLSTQLNLDVKGSWEKYKGEYQYIINYFQEIVPKTEKGIIAYLSSGMIEGLKEKTAKKIVDRFGTQTLDILDTTPEQLLTVRGIGRNKLDKIIKSYQETRSVRDLIQFLAPFDVSPNKCVRISKKLGDAAISIIQHEPFSLCDIDGFGFLTVDAIAKKTSCALNDEKRIEGAICYVLTMAANEGHCCLEQKELIFKAYLLLNEVKNVSELTNEVVTINEVKNVLVSLALSGVLKGDNGMAYMASKYNEEVNSAIVMSKRLTQYNETNNISKESIEQKIASVENEFGITLAQKQKEAVIKSVNENTLIITGGAGTGKTTVLKVILKVCQELLEYSDEDVRLLAPTGRAATRIAESVGVNYETSTIHSALRIKAEANPTSESDGAMINLNEYKIIVVDETSMVDAFIFNELLDAVSMDAKLILIGDAEQLPSVGAGNVLFELLKCGVVPTVMLDTIYRQAETNPIVANSQLIKEGMVSLKYSDKFQLKTVTDYDKKDKERNTKIQTEAAEMVENAFIQAVLKYGLDEVEVLCPYRKKGVIAGASELNKRLQNRINPHDNSKNEFKRGDTVYRVGDKVIQLKNDNVRLLTNGTIGYITDISDDDEVTISFNDVPYVYDATEMKVIDLAYAVTIHKSQGSEFKMAIIPILTAFSIMLKRNLLYTAVTRAKEQVLLVGQQRAITQSIKANNIAKRNTLLGQRIVKLKNKYEETPVEQTAEQMCLFEGVK